MSASFRKTYDTDSIVLRRIFAYDISNNAPFSTGTVLTSLTKGVASFVSPLVALSTIGYTIIPSQISTLSGELFSTAVVMSILYPSSATVFLPSTVKGLGTSGYISSTALDISLISTSVGLGTLGYVSSAVLTVPITSTIEGLGTFGYVSSTQLASTVEGLGSASYISSSQLLSTIEGLATSFYISTGQLTSTVEGLGSSSYISSLQLFSTVEGLGSASYLSTGQLTSTVEGLASASYISTTQLTSTVEGLGTYGYLSSVRILRSTYRNLNVAPWSNAGYLYSNVSTNTTSLSTIFLDIGPVMRSAIIPSTTKLDIELKPNVQFAYYDGTSGNYQFQSLLVHGSTPTTANTVGIEAMTYYILNSNVINLAFFFQEKLRYLITDPATLSSIRNDSTKNVFSLHHTFGSRIPATNQFFAAPASSICATVTLDNTSR
jgi:hypothetical protein